MISTHAGLILFLDGPTFVDNQLLTWKYGRNLEMQRGSSLKTEKGRADILLNPGVFLRLDENSSIRLTSNDLSDTRVEFLGGSAILEMVAVQPGASVVLLYHTRQIRLTTIGSYRIDSDPARLRVKSGKVDIAGNGMTQAVNEPGVSSLSSSATVDSVTPPADSFDLWSKHRSEADNAFAVTALSEHSGNWRKRSARPFPERHVWLPARTF